MGGKRGKRKRLATAIYEDAYGVSIRIRGKEHRYPKGTPTEQLIRKRNDLRDELAVAPARRCTLASDIDAFLLTIPDGRRRDELTTELSHWRGVFGPRASLDVKPIEIKQQLAAWRTDGPNGQPFSAKHCNNLLHSLRAVYTANHGRAQNPALEVKVFPVRYDDARAIPSVIIDRIIDGMPDRGMPTGQGEGTLPTVNLSKLRLRVMRYTGLSQAMLKRVEPHHLDFKRKTMYVTTRLKGAGVEAATLKLIDPAVDAWRALNKAGGLGTFSTRSLAACWRRAVNRAKRDWEAQEAKRSQPRPWPIHEHDRAYDLRHSFGTWLMVETGDLQATADMLRHRNLNTTRRYTRQAAEKRTAQAVQRLNRSKGLS